MSGDTIEIVPLGSSSVEDTEVQEISKLIPVVRFEESVYPTLEHVGTVERGLSDAPHHMVIDG